MLIMDDKSTNDKFVLDEAANVNVGKIGSLCAEVQEYYAAIKSALESIDDLVEASVSFYNGDTFAAFRAKKVNLQLSKENILGNVNSYIDDYNFVVSKFKTKDVSTTPFKVDIK